MKNIVLSVLYFLIVALFMMAGNLISWVPAFILKSLIIPVLMVLFLANARITGNGLNRFFLAGLFFSWAGDVLLEIPKEAGDFFIPGLLSFMTAQAMYLTVFFREPGQGIIRKKPHILLPVFLYGAVLIYFLSGGLGSMKIPVMVYASVILTMLCGAANRYEKTGKLSYWLVLSGAILFVLSDSAIAWSKFIDHFRGSSWFIMISYIAAQYLIVTGYLAGLPKSLGSGNRQSATVNRQPVTGNR